MTGFLEEKMAGYQVLRLEFEPLGREFQVVSEYTGGWFRS